MSCSVIRELLNLVQPTKHIHHQNNMKRSTVTIATIGNHMKIVKRNLLYQEQVVPNQPPFIHSLPLLFTYLSSMSTNRFGSHTEAIFNALCRHSNTRSLFIYLGDDTCTCDCSDSNWDDDDGKSSVDFIAAAVDDEGDQNKWEHIAIIRHWSCFFNNLFAYCVTFVISAS